MLLSGAAGLATSEWAARAADGGPNPTIAWIVHYIAEPVGQVFLRLIFMIAVPLVFSALALGVAGMGDVRKLGRIGGKTLIYTVILSSLSVGLGVGLATWIKPGSGLPEDKKAALLERFTTETSKTLANAQKAKSGRDMILDIIPKNPLQEMVGAMDGSSPGGGMLAVMFFALIVGVAITLSPQKTAPLTALLESVYEVVMIVINMAMRLAPFGVAGLVFSITALLGLDIVQTLGWYVVTAFSGLTIQIVVIYALLIFFVLRTNPFRFFGRMGEIMLTGFATSSSSATLPTALRVTEHQLGVRRDITSFVLTVGSTANQNGTALYEGVTVLFLAQVFGVDLTVTQQFTVVLMAVLAGIGTAGIPGGSLPMIVLVLQSVGVPGEGIGIILGVDRFLDMCRTVVNVTGDVAIAACVDKSERGREPLAMTLNPVSMKRGEDQ
jgi:DAACS family dicarboxylate/amino acid:cation (Na+ or H+) symporter